MASLVRIPSVFITMVAGEWLLNQMHRQVPWNPVQVTIDTAGERKHCCCWSGSNWCVF